MRIGIAMPVFNEADGIAETLQQVVAACHSLSFSVTLFLQDDASTDSTGSVLAGLDVHEPVAIRVERNERNLGHGPTVMRAYRRAVEAGADIIIQLDGDGQFEVEDIRRLVHQICDGADFAVGVRTSRTDPWYRKLISTLVRIYLRVAFHTHLDDPNSPIRAYSRRAITHVLEFIPNSSLIPNVYASVLLRQSALIVTEFPVTHHSRRGDSPEGSTWRGGSRRLRLPRRLINLVLHAWIESVKLRSRILDGA